MRFVLFDINLFNSGERADSESTILWLMEVLTERNIKYLDSHPDTPKLYDSGVTYALPDQMAESRISQSKMYDCERYLKKLGASNDTVETILSFLEGIEVFRDIPQILAKKRVDCDNLTCFRCAELRKAGVKATPYITWKDLLGGGTTYHALVRWPDGTSEDPSLLLGMGGAEKAVQRQEEIRKNHERYDNFLDTAKKLCAVGASNPARVGKQLADLGLLPKNGAW